MLAINCMFIRYGNRKCRPHSFLEIRNIYAWVPPMLGWRNYSLIELLSILRMSVSLARDCLMNTDEERM